MGLGYEGYIGVGGFYALGTGGAVPRARQRLEVSAGYGGKIANPSPPGNFSEMGISLPRVYDWEVWDGSVNFETDKNFLNELVIEWIFDRQSPREVFIAPRAEADQTFTNAFFNSISLSASESGAVDGSISFVAIERTTYDFGVSYVDDPNNTTVKDGAGLLCPPGTFPSPLNPGSELNRNPIPYWNTRVIVDGNLVEFLDWSLDISQDVVKFFSCEHNVSPVEPRFLAMGPLNVGFSGSYMLKDSFLGDTITNLQLFMADEYIHMMNLEDTSENDDLQSADSLTPLAVDYNAYRLVDTR